MWKGNENSTILLFSLKGLQILHQERRGQVKTLVMEHFNSILFHKSGPAKQVAYQSINQKCRKDLDILNEGHRMEAMILLARGNWVYS